MSTLSKVLIENSSSEVPRVKLIDTSLIRHLLNAIVGSGERATSKVTALSIIDHFLQGERGTRLVT